MGEFFAKNYRLKMLINQEQKSISSMEIGDIIHILAVSIKMKF